jgi:outer membrane protein OmpA-like peptidoglycan-associated protein
MPLLLSAQNKDIRDSADHPLVGRYEGCSINSYELKQFEQHTFLTKAPEKGKPAIDGSFMLEGKRTAMQYFCPLDRSTLEIFRNYQQKMSSAGFTTVFQCELQACKASAGELQAIVQPARLSGASVDGDARFAVWRKTGLAGDTAVALVVAVYNRYGPRLSLTVVDAQAMELGKVRDPNAAEMKRSFETNGRVALYGIYFDTGQAVVKPESKETLDQIRSLLKSDPKLQVLVVGHTDNVGDFQSNLALSQRRAEAVVSSLSEFRARLTPLGVGMASPAVPNSSDTNRARNRRVELVPR